MKVDLCDLADPGWAVHVSLEVPLQRVPALARVPVQDRNSGTHRTEVLSSVARMEVPWVVHSVVHSVVQMKVQMVVPSGGCDPAVRATVPLVEVALERVVL